MLCSVGALGLYLFWRWHIHGEATPNFRSHSSWYPVKLLAAMDDDTGTQELGYKSQYEATWRAFVLAGISSVQKTHVMRGCGARAAEVYSVSEKQVSLLDLPLKFIRCVAGFPKEPGQYHLPRATIEPPKALQREIYPFVKEWRRRFRARATRKKSWAQGGLDEDDQAGHGFLTLLKRLRVIVLQDLAILQPDYPGLPFFSLPLFQRQEWVDFAAVVRAQHWGNEVPRSVLLERAVPELNAAICTGFLAQERRTQAQDQAQEQRFQALERRMERDAAQREREAAERGREAKAMAARFDEIDRRLDRLYELYAAQPRVPQELPLAHAGPDGRTYLQVRPSSPVTYSQSINQPVITPGALRPTIGPHVPPSPSPSPM